MNTHVGRISMSPVTAFAIVSLLAAACGGPSASPSAVPSASPSAVVSPAGETYQIEVGSASLGDYLVGEDGMSLYLFANDSAGTSNCIDQCAQNWPPFTIEEGQAVVAGTGVTGEIGTIARPDGETQVTINGLPLYYFIADTAAGDVNGQGVNDVWFLAAPDGNRVTGQGANPAATSDAGDDDPYDYY